MKNSTLLIRSLLIIAILAGSAHVFSSPSITGNKSSGVSAEQAPYLLGKWEVNYSSKEFTGTVVYDIKQEQKELVAYTYQYKDTNGYTEKAEGAKVLTIHSFDGKEGKGTYTTEYEGKTLDIACKIEKVDAKTLKLSYDYYGYSESETWKKQ